MTNIAIAANDADTVILNAKITTMDPKHPEAAAIAIYDGKIVAIGGNDELASWKSARTKVIDAKGQRLVPGFIESHAHMLSYGLSLLNLNLMNIKTKQEVLDKVAREAKSAPKGAWLKGRGWDQNLWHEHEFPSANDLDKVAPDHAVVLTRVDGHAAWLNSKALRESGLFDLKQDPEGGKILRDKAGKPTGIILDEALELVYGKMPEEHPDRLRLALSKALEQASIMGVTTTTEAGLGQKGIDLYEELIQQDKLPVRINIMLSGSEPALLEKYFALGPINRKDRLMIRSIKLMADGALGSRGAALKKEYSDDPGNSGLLILSEDQIYKVSREAVRHGFQVATHAIGDLTNHVVLNAYERAFKEVPSKEDLRFRIEHAQIIDEADIPRFHQLGVIASMQATHCTSDSPWVEARLGKVRANSEAYPWQKLLKSGAIVAGGSDAPVESLNPIWGFYSYITRQDHDGIPKDGWQPDQRLSRMEALKSFTTDGAYAAFLEPVTGSLAVGKAADLVILSKDIMSVEPREIVGTKIELTMVGGQITYQLEAPRS